MGGRGVEVVLLIVVGLIFLMGEVSAIVYVKQSDGFSILASGATGSAQQITTNNSDFWFTDASDDFVYPFNKTGDY